MADNASNVTLQTIINLLIDNCIPPGWIDHAYPFRLNYINHQYAGSAYTQYFNEMDNKRLERIRAYGIPPAIPEWDGWRSPTDEDMHHIRMLIANHAS
jgi:hypothetical protein